MSLAGVARCASRLAAVQRALPVSLPSIHSSIGAGYAATPAAVAGPWATSAIIGRSAVVPTVGAQRHLSSSRSVRAAAAAAEPAKKAKIFIVYYST